LRDFLIARKKIVSLRHDAGPEVA